MNTIHEYVSTKAQFAFRLLNIHSPVKMIRNEMNRRQTETETIVRVLDALHTVG